MKFVKTWNLRIAGNKNYYGIRNFQQAKTLSKIRVEENALKFGVMKAFCWLVWLSCLRNTLLDDLERIGIRQAMTNYKYLFNQL